MSQTDKSKSSPDREMIESVWAEARDLVRRLEGSTVQRLAVVAGEHPCVLLIGACYECGSLSVLPLELRVLVRVA